VICCYPLSRFHSALTPLTVTQTPAANKTRNSRSGLTFTPPRWRLTRWITAIGYDVPNEIRAKLLASLFGTIPIFAGGVINTIMIAAIIVWLKPEPAYVYWLMFESGLALLRAYVLWSALRAAKAGRRTHTDFYLVLGLLWAASVGYGVFITFANGDWLPATLAGVSCGAMAGGICFRNYGAPRLVYVMILLTLGPMCIGAVLSPEPVTLIAFVQVPFYFVAMGLAATKLNKNLVTTMLAERAHERRAKEDPLTGLANRAGILDAVELLCEESGRGPCKAALLYMDLDGFKAVNDAYGHASGDRLLSAIAERINDQLRAKDLAARIGGDEFVVLARNVDEESARALADRLIRSVAAPFTLPGIPGAIHIGLSIGIALIDGKQAQADTLFDAADRALYRAKRAGGGRSEVQSTEELAF
jgi:diguanylate cyclase (GGDEF)-like protein